MKIKDYWKDYAFYTEKLTEFCRKLGFASAAICWFFKTPEVTFPTNIVVSLLFTVLYFLSDIFQYFFGALILRFWLRKKEKEYWDKEKTIDVKVDKPAWIDIPSFVLFILKIIFLILAFIFIIYEILQRL